MHPFTLELTLKRDVTRLRLQTVFHTLPKNSNANALRMII